jgi:hypothetical protein
MLGAELNPTKEEERKKCKFQEISKEEAEVIGK